MMVQVRFLIFPYRGSDCLGVCHSCYFVSYSYKWICTLKWCNRSFRMHHKELMKHLSEFVTSVKNHEIHPIIFFIAFLSSLAVAGEQVSRKGSVHPRDVTDSFMAGIDHSSSATTTFLCRLRASGTLGRPGPAPPARRDTNTTSTTHGSARK